MCVLVLLNGVRSVGDTAMVGDDGTVGAGASKPAAWWTMLLLPVVPIAPVVTEDTNEVPGGDPTVAAGEAADVVGINGSAKCDCRERGSGAVGGAAATIGSSSAGNTSVAEGATAASSASFRLPPFFLDGMEFVI
jgi:hypothetical protein